MTHAVMNANMSDAINEKLAARWSDVGDKIVTMAEEFPADRYDAKPTPDVRSMAEQLRHIAFWNVWVRDTLQGRKADGDANELDRGAFATKSQIVAALKESVDGVKAEILNASSASDASVLDTIVSFIEHNGEHYGQLVMYFRLGGLVPPTSRG